MAILILIVAVGLGVCLTFSSLPRRFLWLLPLLVAAEVRRRLAT